MLRFLLILLISIPSTLSLSLSLSLSLPPHFLICLLLCSHPFLFPLRFLPCIASHSSHFFPISLDPPLLSTSPSWSALSPPLLESQQGEKGKKRKKNGVERTVQLALSDESQRPRVFEREREKKRSVREDVCVVLYACVCVMYVLVLCACVC